MSRIGKSASAKPDRRPAWRLAASCILITLLSTLIINLQTSVGAEEAPPCYVRVCPEPPAPPGGPPDPGGAFPKVVQDLQIIGSATPRGTLYLASDNPPSPHYWIWQIEPICDVQGGNCVPGEYCSGPDQGVYMDIDVQALAQPGPPATPEQPNPPPVVAPPPAPGRGLAFFAPLPDLPVGTPYTGWLGAGQGCVDVSLLNVPPTPEEVLEVFTALPIPGLGFSVQPPTWAW